VLGTEPGRRKFQSGLETSLMVRLKFKPTVGKFELTNRLRLLWGKVRLFFGNCPACGGSYEVGCWCSVCFEQPPCTKEDKVKLYTKYRQELWERYQRRLVRRRDRPEA
jgi:hypothetical protein